MNGNTALIMGKPSKYFFSCFKLLIFVIASANGHTDVVKLLLEKQADFEIKNNNGENALMLGKMMIVLKMKI